MVCAPGAIPRQPGDHTKIDTRDALKLARLHAAGQLRGVQVPSLELEALRDLVRAREDLRGDLMSARHRIGKLLLRRGLIFPGPGAPWSSQRHLAWLGSICLPDPLAQTVLGEYLACHEVLLARRDRLDGLIAEQSTGDKRRQGAITKAGSTHARRLLIESAWHYRRHPAVSLTLKRRQHGQPPAAIDAAWRAQLRLSGRWAHLDARRGKRRTTVAVAVARELSCFVWEIARQPD
jgi:transposase